MAAFVELAATRRLVLDRRFVDRSLIRVSGSDMVLVVNDAGVPALMVKEEKRVALDRWGDSATRACEAGGNAPPR
jgi:hypothetical protein